jgi:surfactin synthase thioesterase subunit
VNGIDRWLWRPRPIPRPRRRLVCFPYAGGGASAFRGWERTTDAETELCVVQLPGREGRRREPFHVHLPTLLEELSTSLPSGWWEAPYLLLGYSMGAVLAFELARHLRRRGLPGPERLLVAACKAPHLLARSKPIHQLPDEEFLARIRRFGGTPEAVLGNPDLLAMLLPVLRADFELLGSYRYQEERPQACPLVTYGGRRDPHASRAELAAWREHTAGEHVLRLFEGGHFFMHDARERVQATLARDLD